MLFTVVDHIISFLGILHNCNNAFTWRENTKRRKGVKTWTHSLVITSSPFLIEVQINDFH